MVREAHAQKAEVPEEDRDLRLPLPEARFGEETSALGPLVGYGLSIVLTVIAFAAVLDHFLPAGALIVLVLALAGLQAVVQLGFFMHLRESVGPVWHVLTLALGIGVALGIVICSIWIMTFRWGVS